MGILGSCASAMGKCFLHLLWMSCYSTLTRQRKTLIETSRLREYKQLDITPDTPGPQVSHNKGRKRTRDIKGKKRATRRPVSRKGAKEESESDFAGESSVETPSKRPKRVTNNVERYGFLTSCPSLLCCPAAKRLPESGILIAQSFAAFAVRSVICKPSATKRASTWRSIAKPAL